MQLRDISVRISLGIFLASLHLCSCQTSPWFNASETVAYLARDWKGSGYADGSTTGASYLYSPLSSGSCLPQPGWPSPCPVDQIDLILLDPAQYVGTEQVKMNLTLRFHGDVFQSSPGADNYYGMPDGCAYERNHTVHADFNVSDGTVIMTIQKTTSDYIACALNFGTSYSQHKSWNDNSKAETIPYQRCSSNAACYPSLDGTQFKGKFRLGKSTAIDPRGSEYRLDLVLGFPYDNAGSNSFSFSSNWILAYSPTKNVMTSFPSSFATVAASQTFLYTLTWRDRFEGPNNEWFKNYMATINSVNPPFGPQDGGTHITVYGSYFPPTDVTHTRNGSIVLINGTSEPQECCDSRYISQNMFVCRLPRVACLNNNPPNFACAQPGVSFENKTVALGIRPFAKGYNGTIPASKLDEFVEHEGTWELIDEDIYGGKYIDPAKRNPNQTQILQASSSQALTTCCPVCISPGDPKCRFTITQLSPGVYNVSIPAIMSPGKPGPCDPATNMINNSFIAGIDRSLDNFSASVPLSITSCSSLSGTCSKYPRISIRTSCKRLYWSLGSISSYTPSGQTVAIYNWVSKQTCERRMRCVAGPCMLTFLAPQSSSVTEFQWRTSSPQVGIYTQYPSSSFDVNGFLMNLAMLINAEDWRRLQLVTLVSSSSLQSQSIGTLFAVRSYEKSSPITCVPTMAGGSCYDFNMIIYIVSEGPGGASASVSLKNLTTRSKAATGDPSLRMLNIMEIYIDQGLSSKSTLPSGHIIEFIKVQYPGVLQFQNLQIQVKKQVWGYAALGVTRTGGSDLTATVNYETIQYNTTSSARGLGEDFASKQGQLRWNNGDSATKFDRLASRSPHDCHADRSSFLSIRMDLCSSR
uniref:IPT/TIG domain-containing protein n=1 Tax=Guillardia theta TaxID=55529 RepID=A0A7S4JVJ4_GUITH|mmetsp:Transcript_18804/g.61744  ORF Transcript_18804/g.61744 Transcript_18804/m.61744 type:complete len:865 (+) Transcript_18804:210-2804(+)